MTKKLADTTLLSVAHVDNRSRQHATAFRREVRAFLADHWSASAAEPAAGAAGALAPRWLAALKQRGWGLTHWPQQDGGPGWSPLERWIWQQELGRAGAAVGDSLTLDGIGPVLCAVPTTPLREQSLERLRSLAARWVFIDAEAHADVVCEIEPGTEATGARGVPTLSLTAPWVAGLPSADAALLRLGSGADTLLLVLDFSAPDAATGVSRSPVAWIGDEHSQRANAVGSLVVTGWPLTPAVTLARGPVVEQALSEHGLGLTSVSLATVGSAALERLDAVIADSFDLDATQACRRDELTIERLALGALEQRLMLLAADDPARLPLEHMRRHRGSELRQRYESLALDALGYDALAYDFRPAGANEPAIGRPEARALIAAALSGRELDVLDEGRWRRLDRLAEALGLAPGQGSIGDGVPVAPE
ncbi:MAG: acyl-CoA dehydrogenase family protein [Pseudomonadota bacterium]